MKPKLTENTVLSGNRRSFLKSAGVLALAAPAVMAGQPKPMPGPSQWWRCRNGVQLLAEGVLPFSFVLPPPQFPSPPPGTPPLEARLRVTFPLGRTKDLLAVQVFLVPEGLPILPLPAAPPLVPQAPTDPVTISYFEMEVADIQFGTSPVPGTAARLPSFAFSGLGVANPVPSPFGDLTGAPCMVSASFLITDASKGEADFDFLSAACAGNHVSMAPSGKGNLVMRQ